MIEREFQKGDAKSWAIYSPCERYRYELTRIWGEGPLVSFIMLNPSTATEYQNDPTVERCERRARALGFGGFRVCNIFAWRSTDPKALYQIKDPVGVENNTAIIDAICWADQTICAWGTHGRLLNRHQDVLTLLQGRNKPIYHLGLTKEGFPKHPLYISYAMQPQNWVIS